MKQSYRQPWLQNAAFDSIYILLPAFIALLVTFFLPVQYRSSSEMPLIWWIVLVLLIDVAHVYSTLFRTYWDKRRFAENKILFTIIPVICYVVGVLIYSVDGLLFWRVLAYLAVFHFIRQQYGFMRLYSRFEHKNTWASRIDTVAIYMATLYPIVYWHCMPGRNFNWFIDGDFIITDLQFVKTAALIVYLVIIIVYLFKELLSIAKQGYVNIPRKAIILSTFLSWYFGIVFFNGDMAFTLLNVVSHGIPYMALVWMFRKKEEKSVFRENPLRIRCCFSWAQLLFLRL
jgi:hypothetical protein